MNRERFEQLAMAYGAEPRRWPEPERAAAQAFVEAEPDAARAVLFEARILDAALDTAPAVVAPAGLRDRILARAPKPRERGARIWFWLPGAGVAAACAAGAVVGLAVMREPAADARAELMLVASADSAWSDAEMTETP